MEDHGVWGVTNTELEQAVAAVDPAALLVPARIVRRVLRQDRGLSDTGMRVPHRKTYFIRREAFAAIVEPGELGLASFNDLPEQLILLGRPEPEQLAAASRPRVLLKYWRLLFHARVHVELDRAIAEDRLNETIVKQRVAQLGAIEFDEIRTVLKQENLLLPPTSDVSTYIEFVAVYSELKHFAPRLLGDYFPSLRSEAVVDEVIGQDFDVAHWSAATRLPGAPEPNEQTVEDEEALIERRADPQATNPRKQSDRMYARLMRLADRAKAHGNDVRAGVMRWWAGLRIGPKLAKAARDAGREDILRLSYRVSRALAAGEDERRAWSELLEELLPLATRGLWPQERRFLYDLQKACVDHEQGVFQLNLVAWILSGGRKPLRQELPNQRDVLMVKHLRGALRRLSVLRISTQSRAKLSLLLRDAGERAEARLREQLRPQIAQALDAVGLLPANRAEAVARMKFIEELLDRTIDRGFLNMGDLRDAISRNDLKLRDITDWRELLGGDEVLRADRALAKQLEGVYRAGELYRRVPQHLSALAFGTYYGRLLTKYVAVPFGGAYVLLEFAQHIVHTIGYKQAHVSQGWAIALLGAFILMLYSPAFRSACLDGLRIVWRLCGDVLVTWPRRLLELDWVRRFRASRTYQLLRQFVFKPLVTTVALGLLISLVRWRPIRPVTFGGLFLFANLLLNSRVGRQVDEVVSDLAVRSWHHFRMRIVKTFVQAIMEFFHEALEAMERVLYAVDEFLRFRSGESSAAAGLKAVFGAVWSVINYVIRFCVTLLIEPQINPIKHFPVVTVGHKFILPLAYTPHVVNTPSWLGAQLMHLFPLQIESANWIAGLVVWGIPGIFGYVAWELRNNWSLYAANRSTNLAPVVVGSHGETVVQLLRTGFHSGTIPKTFARLRRADRKAQATGSWNQSRKYQRRLHDVHEEVVRFVDRELVALLATCGSCRALGLKLGEVGLGMSHLRLAIRGEGEYAAPLVLVLQEKANWLTARTHLPPWFDRLAPEQARSLLVAISGLYKMSGVDLVYENIDECFAPDLPPYEVCEDGLQVCPDRLSDTPVLYDLRHLSPHAQLVSPTTPSSLPTLDRRRVLFASAPMRWSQWVDHWERDARYGDGHGPDFDDRPRSPVIEVDDRR
jgi:hypothetical protein